jgi:hypothetical protein
LALVRGGEDGARIEPCKHVAECGEQRDVAIVGANLMRSDRGGRCFSDNLVGGMRAADAWRAGRGATHGRPDNADLIGIDGWSRSTRGRTRDGKM